MEEAQEIADAIPKVRGANYTIDECLNGGEEKEPVPIFKKLISQYEGLLEASLKIEGLISGVGIHASGVAITNDEYIKQVSAMVAPNGTPITAFDLGDCEKAGIIKYDMLTVSTLDEIHTTLDLLLQDEVIEWKGSLRDTYNAYIHPDVLDYTTPEMFSLLGTDKATNIFQLSTDMSMQACKLLKPKSLMEMTLVNSVIRLAGEQGKESPTQQYVRYKNNINEWYNDLKKFNISDDEKETLKRHLDKSSGLCLSQETLMLMAMDKNISGMTLKETDALRKGIAKKKHKLIEESKTVFYSRGKENGVRQQMLDYVWNEQFALSLSYSFALSHGVAYSCIGLQQLNLLYHYPPIYSQCATLLTNSSSTDDNTEDKIDYGKVASAAFNGKKQGVKFAPADINNAKMGFYPDIKNNCIYWGLKSISNVNSQLSDTIIQNRPYTSFEDFLNKVEVTTVQAISLIKSGAFDSLCNDRIALMKQYILKIVKEKHTLKEKINLSDISKIKNLGILPEEYNICERLYNYNKYITKPEFQVKKVKNKTWLLASGIAKTFFEQQYLPDLIENIDYGYQPEGIVFNKSTYNKWYKQKTAHALEFLNTPNFIHSYNKAIIQNKCLEIWNKYCCGSITDWEFDSLCFYLNQHSLENVNRAKYNLNSFAELSETPIIEEEYYYKDRLCYKYKIGRIFGTVIDNDRTKHSVTLATPDNEVITVKFYAGAFINYNKVIKDEIDGEMKTVDDSWFKRGNKLCIVGYRDGDTFRPKKYKDSIYRHTVALIESVGNNGTLALRELRYGEVEREWNR